VRSSWDCTKGSLSYLFVWFTTHLTRVCSLAVSAFSCQVLNALSCYVDGSSAQPMASFQAPGNGLSPSSSPSSALLPPASERSAASVSRSVQSQAALFREGIDPKGCFSSWLKLGAGASGVVYRATPLNGGCGGRPHVALKVREGKRKELGEAARF